MSKDENNLIQATEQLTKEMLGLKSTIQSLHTEIQNLTNRMNDMSRDMILNVSEAARYCGVARQTISNLLRRNILHKVSMGAHTGILMSDLNRVINLKKE